MASLKKICNALFGGYLKQELNSHTTKLFKSL